MLRLPTIGCLPVVHRPVNAASSSVRPSWLSHNSLFGAVELLLERTERRLWGAAMLLASIAMLVLSMGSLGPSLTLLDRALC